VKKCDLLTSRFFMFLVAGLLSFSQKTYGSSGELTRLTDSLDAVPPATNTISDECGFSGWDGPADACYQPLWTVNAGTVILHRETPNPSPIILNVHTRAMILDASDFKFDWAAGSDIEVTRRIVNFDAIDAVDFRYFGVQSAEADTSIDTVNSWRPAYSGQGSILRSRIDTLYQSQVQSAELNVLRDASCGWLTWLAGVRWVGLDEEMNLTARVGSPGNYGHPFYYTYATRNDLYGGQIGAAVTLWDRCGPFRANCLTRAGLYGNTASNQYDGVDSFGDYALLSTDRKSTTAFVGDVNFTAAYQLTKHVALQGGYQLLWIQGVAVAGDQPVAIDLANDNGMASNGGVFYHGAMASISVTW
jgi:hypothetical protein